MATNSPIDFSSDRQSDPASDKATNNANQKPITTPIKEIKDELILCDHCLRTATNGIKCQGICVADSGY